MSRIYKLLFGRLDERAYQQNRNEFVALIKIAFSNVLAIHKGSIVPHEGEELPRAFDFVAVTLEFPQIRFRLIRGRGELRIQFASKELPRNWQELNSFWNLVREPEWVTLALSYSQLDEFAEELERGWEKLLNTIQTASLEARG